PRAALAAALERGLAPHAPAARVLENVRALALPGSLAVVTGQQPGLLGGPLYCLHKALSTVVLARALERELGTRVVPVYWNHADDHDIAEVHHAWVMNEHFDWRKVGLSGVSSGRVPIGELALSDAQHRIGAIGQLLLQLLPNRPSRARALEDFLPREGESLASVFTRAFTRLLGAHGLVVLEPAWLRGELAPALARIARADAAAALARGAERVLATGRTVTIDPATAALLFEHRDDGRHGWRLSGRTWSRGPEQPELAGEALAARILSEPTRWSGAALARPLAQDLALPVVAYVGGPGEQAYHAQLDELRDACGAPRTPFVARASLVLVTRDVEDSLRTLGLSLEQALLARGELGPSREPEPQPAVIARLSEIATRASRELAAEREALAELDPGLAIQLRQSADQVKQTIRRLVEKAERVDMNRRGRGTRHVRRVAAGLTPRGEAQERVATTFEWVARHGDAWIGELLEALPPLPKGPLAVHLDLPVD
ncbi:MAG: bacillithiol biosynthesis cysteine-adding enzyme BshC, partial [Planctomycetes bacterium]|nr:bacillithiol biosynthesis cysteine-adding enzyme BshC [Planctomycetota bacterium]